GARSEPGRSELLGALAPHSPWLRPVLRLEIERHRSADELLQGRLIDLFALVDVDGAPDISLEAGVEEPRRVVQRSSSRRGHLDDLLGRLSGANDPGVRPHGSPHPLPLFDDLWICAVDDLSYPCERLSTPVAKFLDLFVDECGRGVRRNGLFHA